MKEEGQGEEANPIPHTKNAESFAMMEEEEDDEQAQVGSKRGKAVLCLFGPHRRHFAFPWSPTFGLSRS